VSGLPVIRDLTVSEYFAELASDSLFPSAGAAAALTGAQGGALFAMVCRVNIRKIKEAGEGGNVGAPDQEQLAFWERALELAGSCTRRFLDLAQEDGTAYREVVDEKPQGPSHSIEVPLGIARCAGELAELIVAAFPKSYTPVCADAETALYLVRGSKKAALTVARYNLPLLKKGSEREYYVNQIEELSK